MWNSKFSGKEAGHISKSGYVTVSIDWEAYEAHRVIWKMVTGEDPREEIDHKNGVRWDNRPHNLREATRAENNRNSSIRSGKLAKLKGAAVSRRANGEVKYQAQIQVDGVKQYLGVFDSEEEAHTAYSKAAVKLHKDFHNLGGPYISERLVSEISRSEANLKIKCAEMEAKLAEVDLMIAQAVADLSALILADKAGTGEVGIRGVETVIAGLMRVDTRLKNV